MSRLNASSEPSMEEILASIRKIIAEEPPGSRPGPAANSLGSTPERGFMARDPFMRSPGAPAGDRSAASRASPTGGQSAAVAPPSLRSQPSAPPARNDAPMARPSLRSGGGDVAPARVAPEPAARSMQPKSDAAPSAPAAAESKSSRVAQEAASSARAAASATGAEAKLAKAEFEAPVAEARHEPKAEEAEIADPFEFDLGPSPFAVRGEQKSKPAATGPVEAEPASESVVADDERSASPAVEDVNATMRAAEKAVSDSLASLKAVGSPKPFSQSESAAEPSRPLQESEPGPGRAAERRLEAPIKAEEADFGFGRRSTFELPSVEATLGPIRKLASPYPDILTPSPASSTPPEPSAHDRFAAQLSSQPSLSNLSGSTAKPVESARTREPETVVFEGALAPLSMPMTDIDHRTMEDTVADLLRPMLKSWLAENMPRIIERALRREMLEHSQPGQKSAAE